MNSPKTNDTFARTVEVASLVILVLTFTGNGQFRVIPGGPFFYVSTDVLPVIAIAAILGSTGFRRTMMIGDRIFLGVMVIIFTLVWVSSIEGALRFLYLPSARGDWFRW